LQEDEREVKTILHQSSRPNMFREKRKNAEGGRSEERDEHGEKKRRDG